MKEKKEDSQKYLYIKKNWCKRCGICVEFCPVNIIEFGPDGYPAIVDLEKCIECKRCVVLCPDFAVIRDPQTEDELKER